MIANLITSDIPIRDEGVIGVSERSVVSHGRSASIGVLALCKELVNGIQGVRLNGIVCCEYDELRDICLRTKNISATGHENINDHDCDDIAFQQYEHGTLTGSRPPGGSALAQL